MTIPLVAIATAAVSILIPKKSKSSSIQPTPSSHATQFLLVGIVTGMGLYAYIDHQLQKYRIRERSQAWLFSQQTDLILQKHDTTNTDDGTDADSSDDNDTESTVINNNGLFLPTPARNLPSIPLPLLQLTPNATTSTTNNGTESQARKSILTSPQIPSALTSSLHVVEITLPKRSKMEVRKALGMELYYVLSGRGTFGRILLSNPEHDDNDNENENDAKMDVRKALGMKLYSTFGRILWQNPKHDNNENENENDGHGEEYAHTSDIQMGDTFIVNPWSARWIANHGSEDLIFLRISDAGKEYDIHSNEYDVIVPNDKSAAMVVRKVLTSGFQRVKRIWK